MTKIGDNRSSLKVMIYSYTRRENCDHLFVLFTDTVRKL